MKRFLILFLLLSGCANPQFDLIETTVADVHTAYAAGNLSAVELTQAYLDRIKQYDDSLGAFIILNPMALE